MTQYYQHWTAALLAMGASAILSFVDNFVAKVALDASLWQFHLVRAIFALPLIGLIAWISGASLRPKNTLRVALRSGFVVVGLLIYFGALGFLSVAQAGAGIFSAPLWLLLFSVVIFGRKIGIRQVLAVFAGFSGVLMLLQPDLTTLSVLSFLPLLAGAFYGMGMLVTRHWCNDESPLAMTAGIFVIFAIVSSVVLLALTLWPVSPSYQGFLTGGWTTPTPRFMALTLLQSAGAVVAVTLLTQAYRVGDPPNVSVFEYSFLIFASILSYVLWGHSSNFLAQCGIATIICAGIVISTAEKRAVA
jgi:drug/metabolite transporter (DMT)-like permease